METSIYSTRKASKTYNTFELSSFDFVAEAGKVYGIIGENAAGKTTFLRLAAHNLANDKGELYYPFLQNKNTENWEIAYRHVAYITQELTAWKGKMYEYIIFSAVTHGMKPQEAIAATERTMQRFEISDLGTRNWSELSGGYKLRFALAAAFVWQPKLVVMDEPLANLDINTQHLILQTVKDLAHDAQNPIAVLVSSQHLIEVESIADELIFIDAGKITFQGSKADFGNDRATNLFELNCDADTNALQKAFFLNEKIKIKASGFDVLVETPLDIDAAKVLQMLINQGISVNYFRNISQSSKKMFINE